MSGRLDARVAVITGAGRGIGAEIAHLFAQEGARLLIASRTQAELNGVAERCRTSGAECQPIVTDVSVIGDVRALIREALTAFGKIDIVVNAAGVYGPIGPIAEIDVEAWMGALRVNLIGTLLTCREAIPSMIERQSGSIINFSGGGAAAPLPRFSAYGVSKAAVVRLTETLAQEVAEQGIRVNAIAPGAVDTRLQDEVLKAGERAGPLYERILALRERGVGATPVGVAAGLALFLASADSDGLSGRLISAPHDGWSRWTRTQIEALKGTPWYTLRRIDPFTVKSLGEAPG